MADHTERKGIALVAASRIGRSVIAKRGDDACEDMSHGWCSMTGSLVAQESATVGTRCQDNRKRLCRHPHLAQQLGIFAAAGEWLGGMWEDLVERFGCDEAAVEELFFSVLSAGRAGRMKGFGLAAPPREWSERQHFSYRQISDRFAGVLFTTYEEVSTAPMQARSLARQDAGPKPGRSSKKRGRKKGKRGGKR